MTAAHALLSASGAERWINCPPSARIEADLPETTSRAAEEGTAAHALAEHKLLRALKKRSKRPTSEFEDDAMGEHTDNYVDYVLSRITELKEKDGADPFVIVEARLDFSHIVPDGFGTGDCVILSNNTLIVIDLKYGQGVQVEAEGNPQMRLYALGALETYGALYDIETVEMVIWQPRRNHYPTATLTVAELEAWAEQTVRPAAELAYAGEGAFQPGPWCGFCKIAATCRARADQQLALAAFEFAPPAELDEGEMATVLQAIPDLKAWASSVEAYAEAEAVKGRKWPGMKLVQGRSIRRYTNENDVVKAASEAGYTDIFDKKLLPITAMEKLMGKKQFTEILGEHVTKPAGKLQLVPATDKRTEVTVEAATDEFTEIK